MIAYVICMVMFGCPLVYMETTLSQYADGGPIIAWKVMPLFNGKLHNTHNIHSYMGHWISTYMKRGQEML